MTERDEVLERARSAQTFLQQAFWKEMEEFLNDLLNESLNSLRKPYPGSEEQIQALMKWRATEELVNKVLNYPVAAIDQAREEGHKF